MKTPPLAVATQYPFPVLVGAITDHVFRDRSQVGGSITLAVAICGSLAVLLLFLGLKPLRAAVREADAVAAGAEP